MIALTRPLFLISVLFYSVQSFAHPGELDLGTLDANNQPSFFTQTRLEPNLPVRLTLDFRKDLAGTAISMRLKLNPDKVQDLALLDLVQVAFNDRYSTELATLQRKYSTQIKIERKVNVWQFTVTGEDRYAPRTLGWLMEQLAEFVPTLAEMERARGSLEQSLQSKYLGESGAMISLDIVRASLDPLHLSILDTRQAVLDATEPQIVKWRQIVARAQKELVMTGDLTDTDGLQVHQAVRKLSPAFLTEQSAIALAARSVWKTGTEIFKFPAGRNGDGPGMVRIYKGPSLFNLPDLAAFRALSSLLGAKSIAADEQHAFLFLYGQTEIQHWDDALTHLASGRISDEEITHAVQDVVIGLSQQKTSVEQVMEEYDAGQSLQFDARATRELLTATTKLKPADVRAIAQKYILNPNVKYRQLTLVDCESLLN